MPLYHDQTGHTILLAKTPRRIVSIVPSQSELLWDLGLSAEIKGISSFCIHPPEMFNSTARVGGTKKLNINAIRALQPDLVIGNREENSREEIELLRQEFNVWVSDIVTINDAYAMMEQLGQITGHEDRAKELVQRIRNNMEFCKNMFSAQKVAYFIWHQPWMLAANGTFIHEMLNWLGFENTAANLSRYPEMDAERLKALKPEFCFLSSEPYPFKEQHAALLREILPDTRVMFVDGEMFSWYGSRLLKMSEYAARLKKAMDDQYL